MSPLHLRAILSLALALVALLWSNALLSLGELKDKQAQFSSDLGLSEKATFFRMTLVLVRGVMKTLLFAFIACFALFIMGIVKVDGEPIIRRVIADDYVLVFYLVCMVASLVVLLVIVLRSSLAALLRTSETAGKAVSRVIVRGGIVLFSPEKLGLSIYQFITISVLVFVSFSLPIWIPSDRPSIMAQVGLFLFILSIPSYFVVASLPLLAWLWLRNPGVRDWFGRVNQIQKAARESLRFSRGEALQEYKKLLRAYLGAPIELLLTFPTLVIIPVIQYSILSILLWIASFDEDKFFEATSSLCRTISTAPQITVEARNRSETVRLSLLFVWALRKSLTLALAGNKQLAVYSAIASVAENSLDVAALDSLTEEVVSEKDERREDTLAVCEAYRLLFEGADTGWQEALSRMEGLQHLKYGNVVFQVYSTISKLKNLASLSDITSTLIAVPEAHQCEKVFLRDTVDTITLFGQIADILARAEKVGLSDKLPYYALALEKLGHAGKLIEGKYGPGRNALVQIHSTWQAVVIERIKELKGRARLTIRLDAHQFPMSKDEISLPLSVKNEGTSVAEHVVVSLDIPEAEITLPEINLGLISPGQKAHAEFRIKPLQVQNMRAHFIITFDDLEQKGKQIEFADAIEFYEEAPSETFQPLDPNPYVAGPALRTKEMFFGREDVFQYIQTNLIGRYQDNVIVLHGQRRTGKTSTLYQIPERLRGEYVPVLVDMQGLSGGMDGFFYGTAFRIVEALERRGIFMGEPERDAFRDEPEAYFRSRFLREVQRHIGDRHLVLMIDEFEVIEENIERGVLDSRLLDYLRSLMQHSPKLGFILAGTQKIEEMAGNYWSIFFNLALYKKISFLDEAATEQLITQPVEGYFRYDPLALHKIKAVTGGHPYFTQLLCRKLVDFRNERRLNYINVQHINDVIDSVVAEGEANIVYIWRESSLPEKLFMVALSETIRREGVASTTDVSKFLQRKNIVIDVPGAVRALEARDVVVRWDGRCEFTVGLFQIWLEQNYNAEKTLMEANHEERESLLSSKGN